MIEDPLLKVVGGTLITRKHCRKFRRHRDRANYWTGNGNNTHLAVTMRRKMQRELPQSEGPAETRGPCSQQAVGSKAVPLTSDGDKATGFFGKMYVLTAITEFHEHLRKILCNT